MKTKSPTRKMNLRRRQLLITTAVACVPGLANGESIRSWRSLRDDRVIKQQLDYSCGAASVATILREFYGIAVQELDILERLTKNDSYSFADLAAVVEHWGLKGTGIALGFDKLTELKVPAIAHVLYRGQDHFTVISGINPSTGVVSVADPSWGNRKFKEYQFRDIWEIRADADAEGRLLLIVPGDETAERDIDRTFFKTPGGWNVAMDSIGPLRVF